MCSQAQHRADSWRRGPGFSSPGRFSPEGLRKMGPTGMSVWTLEAQTPVSGAKCIVRLGAEARGRSE